MHGNPKTYKLGDPRKPEMNLGIDPERCNGNRAITEGQVFRVFPTDDAPHGAVGKSDRDGVLHAAKASEWGTPDAAIRNRRGESRRSSVALIDLRAGEDRIFWAVQAAPAEAEIDALPVASPEKAFQGWNRLPRNGGARSG